MRFVRATLNYVWVVIKRRKLFVSSLIIGLISVWIFAGTAGFMFMEEQGAVNHSRILFAVYLLCCIAYLLSVVILIWTSGPDIEVGLVAILCALLSMPCAALLFLIAVFVCHLFFTNLPQIADIEVASRNMKTAALLWGEVIGFYCVLGILLEVVVSLGKAVYRQTRR